MDTHSCTVVFGNQIWVGPNIGYAICPKMTQQGSGKMMNDGNFVEKDGGTSFSDQSAVDSLPL